MLSSPSGTDSGAKHFNFSNVEVEEVQRRKGAAYLDAVYGEPKMLLSGIAHADLAYMFKAIADIGHGVGS